MQPRQSLHCGRSKVLRLSLRALLSGRSCSEYRIFAGPYDGCITTPNILITTANAAYAKEPIAGATITCTHYILIDSINENYAYIVRL